MNALHFLIGTGTHYCQTTDTLRRYAQQPNGFWVSNGRSKRISERYNQYMKLESDVSLHWFKRYWSSEKVNSVQPTKSFQQPLAEGVNKYQCSAEYGAVIFNKT